VRLAENIKLLRERYKLSQSELAEMLGFSKTQGAISVQNYETGYIQPSIATLTKITNIFYVSFDWLFGRDTSKDGEPPDFIDVKEKQRLAEIKKLEKGRLLKIEKLKKELAELEGVADDGK